MPNLTTLRGWLYHPAVPMYERVRDLISERYLGADARYPHAWILPRDPDQFWDFTFLGDDVHTADLPEFRTTIQTIAETVMMPDGYPPMCMEGYFRWDSDNGESGEWKCAHGKFHERRVPHSCDWSLEADLGLPSNPNGE